jgi:hypothetical protein
MYLKKLETVLILVATLFAAGCARKPEIRSYVPESAAFFVEITEAGTFFADADGFVKELGLQALLQNKGLMEFADEQLKTLFQGFSLSMLDLTNPVGVAVILPGAGESDPTFIVYLPLKAEKDFEELGKVALTAGLERSVRAGTYGIVYTAENEMKLPPEKTLDLSGLDKYKSGSLSYFVNVKGLLSQYGAGLDAAVASFMETLKDSGGAMDEATQTMMKGMAAMVVDAVRQTDTFDGSIKLTQEGLVTRSAVGFAKGKGLAAFTRALAASKNPGPFVKYLPKDHLFSMAADVNPGAQKLASDFLVDFLFNFYGLTAEEAEYYRGLMKTMLAQAGTKSAFGMDMNMDFGRLAAMDASTDDIEKTAALAMGAIGIKGVGVYGVKNGPAYLALMRSMYDDPRFQAVMNKSAAASGMKIGTRIEDAKESDFSYQTYTFTFEAVSPDSHGVPMTRGMLNALSDMMKMYLAPAKDRIYITLGKESLPELSAIVKADAHSEDLSKDPDYAAFVKLAGSDGQLISRLSVNRLLSFVSGAAGMATGKQMSFSIPEEANTGMWTLFRASGDSLQSVGFWGAKEIGSIVQQAGAVAAQSFMR